MECNIGQVFENKMLQKLLHEVSANDIIIQTEIDLRKKYGFSASGIDFCIYSKSHVLFVQCKYCKSRRRETKYIYKFLNSVKFVQNKIDVNGKICVGFWIARFEPFEDNKKLLEQHQVFHINHYDSMETLLTLATNAIKTVVVYADGVCDTAMVPIS